MSSMVFMIIMSIIMAMCSTHWVMVWLILEINTLIMCGILSKDMKMQKHQQSSNLIYFLIQTLSSILLLMFSMNLTNKWSPLLVIIPLLMKMGMWPMHLWYMKVINITEMKQSSMLILMTLQKVIPVLLLVSMKLSNISLVMIIIMSTNTLMISISNMMKKSSVKSIMALSSLNTNSWLILSVLSSVKMFFMFMMFYWMAMKISLKEMKMMTKKMIKMTSSFVTLLVVISNLGGLPPFFMFSLKIMTIKFMIQTWWPTEIFMLMMMVACYFMYNYLWMMNYEIMKFSQKQVNKVMKTNNLSTKLVIYLSIMTMMIVWMLDFTKSGLLW